MITTIRAGISVAMLAGFYVFAFGIVAALAALAAWLWRTYPGGLAVQLSWLVLAVAGGMLLAVWKVARARPEDPAGVEVTPAQAAELWSQVRAIAAEVGTRAPDEIRLVGEVNAAVTERATLMGLRGGRRTLYLGLPLVQGLTVGQLRAVLAHELGHYSHSHTRLGELSYRGLRTMVATIIQVGEASLTGWLLRGYFRLYLLVHHAVQRRQELEADRAMVRVAGRPAAVSALRELRPLDKAWNYYLDNYVGWGLDSGAAPADIVRRFSDLLAGRGKELAQTRSAAPEAKGSRWDTHPPVAQRIAVIEAEPDPGVPADERPATNLLPHLPEAAAAVEKVTFDFGQLPRVSFEDYTAQAMQARSKRDAELLYRAAAGVAGVPNGSLGTVLDLIEAGRAAQLRDALTPRSPDPDARLVAELRNALSTALAEVGSAHFVHSWSGPPTIVGRNGSELDVQPLIHMLASRPPDVATVRVSLTAMGVSLT